MWPPAIRRLDRVIANSQATARLAQAIGVSQERLAIVHPGVELPNFDDTERQRLRRSFRTAHGLGERPVLLSVGRLTTRKGLIPFVRKVLPLIAAKQPKVRLVIVGDVPKHALAAEAERPEQILAAAQAAGVEQNLVLLGRISEHEPTDSYYAADVHVFPVREIPGDPEGFGMVAIEAAAHGLPTVAYATGGVVEAVADGVSGILVKPGEHLAFAEAVLAILARPWSRQAIMDFAAAFAWERFGKQIWHKLYPKLAKHQSHFGKRGHAHAFPIAKAA